MAVKSTHRTLNMYEQITYPYRPRPDVSFRPASSGTVAKWSEHRSRRTRVAERGGSIYRHPWRGERQGGSARGLFQTTVRQVDRELTKVPYHVRTTLPKSGAYPVVQGVETGLGPNVLVPTAPARLSRGAQWLMQNGNVSGRATHAEDSNNMMMVSNTPVDRDVANIIIGPYAPAVQPFYDGDDDDTVVDRALADAGMEVGASAGAEAGQTLGQLAIDYVPGLVGGAVGGLVGLVGGPGGVAAGAAAGFGVGKSIGDFIKPVTKRIGPVAGRAIGRRLGAHAGRSIAVGA